MDNKEDKMSKKSKVGDEMKESTGNVHLIPDHCKNLTLTWKVIGEFSSYVLDRSDFLLLLCTSSHFQCDFSLVP